MTEAGYPSDDRFQYDERYRGGEAAQARYLRDALPAMARAGVEHIFVTTRDTWASEFGLESPFASEGIVSLAQDEPYSVRRKPAFDVVLDLTRASEGKVTGACRGLHEAPRASPSRGGLPPP